MTKRMRNLGAWILALSLTAAPLAENAWAQEGTGADRARTQRSDEGFDGWGLWGLAGLVGLAGLMRRGPEHRAGATRT